MATIIREIDLDVRASKAWDALRDFGAVHERIAPGFLVDGRLDDPDTRVVTFSSGAVAREQLVGIDDTRRRLAYSVIESALGATHHNASAQILPVDEERSRFVWITDVLPDRLAEAIGPLMDQGIAVIKQTLELDRSGSTSCAPSIRP
jgi:hypothetical protein